MEKLNIRKTQTGEILSVHVHVYHCIVSLISFAAVLLVKTQVFIV